MTEKMQLALQVIASWAEIDLDGLSVTELKEIIKSMTAVAVEALEPDPKFPWQ